MVNSMVERATSDMLIGPDWAMNIEICDMLNREPGQAKDVVRGIKKRLGSKNSKVQLLALTLLETIIKNCGDIVHMHVAERDVLHEMVKIARKKQPDFHVKEKILILIDTWQEAFGGPRARYPQYFAAYQELLRAGAVFPQRSEAAPVFTPPQTHPLSSYPANVRGAELRPDAPESSAESEFPTLSLTEIQNARGIMDVLAEMLNAIDPGNKEGLKQEVIVDLVEQCRTYKQRVVHLVNSTSDESLLGQGLALNDDLQRVLAKHESIASGNPVETEKPKPKSSGALVDLIDTGDSSKELNGSAGTNSLNQLLLPAPPVANGSATPQKMDPKMDLLSGEDFSSPKAENSLALVHTGGQQSTAMPSDQNALVLMDMFSDTPNLPNPINTQGANLGQNNQSAPQFQQQPNIQAPQTGFYANGAVPSNLASSQFDQTLYNQNSASAWNGQIPQQQPQQQPTSPAAYGSPSAGALPPPPWEAQAAESSQGMGSQYPQQMPPSMGNEQSMPMHMPQMMVPGQYAAMNSHPAAQQPNQMYGLQPQQMQAGPYMGMVPPQMQGSQMAYMYPQQMYGGQGQVAAYGYGQAGAQYLDQRMYGLSVRDDSGVGSPHSYRSSTSAASYLPPMKQQSKPEDKLFGDLVDMAKVKSSKPSTPPSKAGSL